MEDITMELSREDFGQLLLMVGIGDFIRGAVMESREGVPGDEGVLLGKLMSVAEKNGFSDAQRHEGHIYPSLEFEQKQMEFIEEYNDGEFWSELEHRLGRRDFERSMTEEDRQYMEKEQWMPERIYDLYTKYADEFETYGIDRLEINKDAPVSDIRDALY